MKLSQWCSILLCSAVCAATSTGKLTKDHQGENALDAAARNYLDERNRLERRQANEQALASWAYDTNITDANELKLENVQKEQALEEKKQWKEWLRQEWDKKWTNITDPGLRRQMEGFSTQGISALPENNLTLLNKIEANMTAIYSTAKVDLCAEIQKQSVCELNLEPELTQLLAENRSYDVLRDAWIKWRDASGRLVRQQYIDYVNICNEAASLNGYSDTSEKWVEAYESPTFREDVETLWQQVRPLYEQLHAYVRRKLIQVYGADKINRTGPIPAHLLGDMWAQKWGNIYNLVVPYPNKPTIDVTEAMKEQSFTATRMFELADQFYTGLNLIPMPPKFWSNSVISKPNGTEMVCHASAWDFYDGEDFRIKMCTDITMEDLYTVHHEMGHVEYYLHYKDQPFNFLTGANPGFHEAVGDSLALSVQTPKHLHKIGLLDAVVEDDEADINFLLKVALDKIAFLPFGYLIDKYRWQVFKGEISSANLNCGWWDLRYELQGLKAPVMRNEDEFDPGSKYHVVADVPYIRYFVSFIVQFQFYKAMCIKADQYDPSNSAHALHKCDIDKSTAAGEALGKMLRLGASVPWPDALQTLTGTRELDASVLREYFKPLEEWLIDDNARHGEYIGWKKDGECCEGPAT